MPRGDGTGPAGMGPMTGRAAGYCAGFNRPGFTNSTVRGGGGFGRGRSAGGGRGRRNWFYRTGMPGYARAAQGMPAYGNPGPAYGPAAQAAQANAQGQAGYSQPSPEDELNVLRQQSEALSQQLEQINQRINDLEQQTQE